MSTSDGILERLNREVTVSSLDDLVREHTPSETILFFGAGSSIPSGAPSVSRIMQYFSQTYGVDSDGYSLAEFSELIERKVGDRAAMVRHLRSLFRNLKPTGGLANVALYEWKSIYTTNYDELIESAFKAREIDVPIYASDFDFRVQRTSEVTKLFKLHGTISKDISDGIQSRIVLTESDYKHTHDYRNKLYDRLKSDLADSKLIIIGYSLSDPHIRDIISRATELNEAVGAPGRITLLMYQPDENRKILYEGRGVRVVFGGIDEFFAALAKKEPVNPSLLVYSGSVLDSYPSLRPVTTDIAHSLESGNASPERVFNGWPAGYRDIAENFTFPRTVARSMLSYLRQDDQICAVVLGASGVGKTTAARQMLVEAKAEGFACWEHKSDHALNVTDWLKVANDLAVGGNTGILFIDDAHSFVFQINDLIDQILGRKLASLKLVCVSSRNQWGPRVKTPNIYRFGREFALSRLDHTEIDSLIALVDSKEELRRLVENTFSGFSAYEKRRRLTLKCEADMFVCLKNIFASEAYDDIILREYASLQDNYREIYRLISALEFAGIRVHRQLVIRVLGIPPASIGVVLSNLDDIIIEYDISLKEGIFGWRGRHPVITGIIARYKFSDTSELIALFEKVIDDVSPTYDVEVRSLREFCSLNSGLSRIGTKKDQNRILRRIISALPGERVPRHRLIRNLIDMGEFDQAHTEIRIFENDFRSDGPVARYRIVLLIARATRTPGLLPEDRIAILGTARDEAVGSIQRYPSSAPMYAAYCEVGVQIFKMNASLEVYDDAMRALREAEMSNGDPEMTRIFLRYQSRLSAQYSEDIDIEEIVE